ncbi:hypothetical protein TIFTF001_000121 [Ficus carica]|uniref:Uncharacterized protein n=1 Tax=Ficus carica TaxID=3494 RepID=A0AA87ZBZ4_FICCA|nr:hypothetical protein TIFTF001_000121 [Ficus carica]
MHVFPLMSHRRRPQFSPEAKTLTDWAPHPSPTRTRIAITRAPSQHSFRRHVTISSAAIARLDGRRNRDDRLRHHGDSMSRFCLDGEIAPGSTIARSRLALHHREIGGSAATFSRWRWRRPDAGGAAALDENGDSEREELRRD